MGAVCSGLLQRVVNTELFDKKQSGPTLRRLFGAYRNPDFWAVYRRFRAIDDGNGYVSYEELLQCVCLAEYQLLFLWETFSQQNELIHARELMTVICVFSSAPLLEKGKFLQALFDESNTGLNTASEIVSILHMVLAVLTKCTGIPVKIKEVRDQLKSILPDMLPTWVDALERAKGKSEVAFQTSRFIGQIELELLLPTIVDTYETLPIAGPPPPGALSPPPPDWATPSSLEKGVSKQPDKEKATAKSQGVGAKALTKAELAHLDWMSKMDEDDAEGLANVETNGEREDDGIVSAKGWMVIYGTDFSQVLKNQAAFRHLFMRSVSTSLGIPMGCVEVVNITRGTSRGVTSNIVIEFGLNPSRRGNDVRDGNELKEALSQQLQLPHSALRKGPFKDYCLSAELVERPDKTARSAAATTQKAPVSAGHCRDMECQTELQENEEMQEILRDLEATEAEARSWQTKAEEAIAQRDAALEELAALKAKAPVS